MQENEHFNFCSAQKDHKEKAWERLCFKGKQN